MQTMQSLIFLAAGILMISKSIPDINGIRGISKVVYKTEKKNADALRHLVQDDILQVIDGDSILV